MNQRKKYQNKKPDSSKVGKKNTLWQKWENKPFLPILIILLLTFVALSPMLKNGFTNWDDPVYVTGNELLKNLSWDGIKAIFSTPVSSHYHPLTVLSLALNYQSSGLNPFSYLLTNLILHLLNTLLVFYFVYRLANKKLIPAIIVGLFFGIHPMHVESVAWISERKDVLYTFFLLSAMLGYLKYQENPGIKNYLFTLVLFVLSLLSKPTAMIFPALLILIDYLQYKPLTLKKFILEKIPFGLLALAALYMTLQNQSVHTIAEGRFTSMESFLFGWYGFVIYIVKLFVPFKLSALHPFPEVSGLGTFYYIAPVISLAIFILAYKFRKYRVLIFGLGFYLVAVFPFLQFFPYANAVIADRYTYVAYVGLLFIIGIFIDDVFHKKKSFPGGKTVINILLIAVALTFMAVTHERTKIWNNSQALWTDVIKKYPDSYRAYMSRGSVYVSEKKYQKAIEDLNRSLKINPTFTHSLELRGISYINLGEYSLALPDLQKWKEAEPDNAEVYIHLAIAQKNLGQPEEALSSLNQAIELNPGNAIALTNRGTIYFNNLKEYKKALDDFNRAISVNPGYGLAYYNRANCYLMLGDKTKARESAEKAIELGVNVPQKFFEYLE